MNAREQALNRVTTTGNRVNRLEKLRDTLIRQRDAAAWSLHTYGTDGQAWTNPRIRAIFGASSHNAWTKSRQRMNDTYTNGNPLRVDHADLRLESAAIRLGHVHTAHKQALQARADAYRAALAVDPSITFADLGEAAGKTRQAVWAELGKKTGN